jgi:hypothetical protein
VTHVYEVQYDWNNKDEQEEVSRKLVADFHEEDYAEQYCRLMNQLRGSDSVRYTAVKF